MDNCPKCGTKVDSATVTEKNGETITYKGCHECDWIEDQETKFTGR